MATPDIFNNSMDTSALSTIMTFVTPAQKDTLVELQKQAKSPETPESQKKLIAAFISKTIKETENSGALAS